MQFAIAIRSANCIFYGDSITEGEYNTGPFGSGPVANSDAEQSYVVPLATSLGCEWGNLGFGGTGWLTSNSSASIPAFTTTYSNYFGSFSRLVAGKLSPVPNYMFVNEGVNDSSSIVSTIVSMATTLRGIVNVGTPIFIITPFGHQNASYFPTAFSSISDSKIYSLDLGTSYTFGMTGGGGGSPSLPSYDSCHPRAQTHGILATSVQSKVNSLTGTGASNATPFIVIQ